MIKSLSLTNFKSIGKTLIVNDDGEPKEGKLEFGPLTIFCGKNSSGKSTVLQSILLLAQTLRNNAPSHTLVLNGNLVNFGSFREIKSEYNISDIIDIEIEFYLSKPIKNIDDVSSLETICKRVYLEKISKHYYISNNLEEIKNTLIDDMGYYFLDLDNKLSPDKWKQNIELSNDIIQVMNEYNVNFSARIGTNYERDYGEYVLEVHKREKNKWYSIFFGIDLFDTSNLRTLSSLPVICENDNLRQSLKMSISFFDGPLGIWPKIDKINIELPSICKFKAEYKENHEEIKNKFRNLNFYNIDIDDITKKSLWENKQLVGLILNHFLPSEFVYLRRMIEFHTKHYIGKYVYDFLKNDYIFDEHSIENFNKNIKQLIQGEGRYKVDLSTDVINDILRETTIQDSNEIVNIDSLIPYAEKCISVLDKSGFTEKLKEKINLTTEENDKYNYSPGELGVNLKNCVDGILKYFNHNIIYIGPLREEPHLQYSAHIDDTIDIGIKGENCASVLYHSKNISVKYINPDTISGKIIISNKYLNNALNEWLRYIEVADGVIVNYNTRYGYELKINTYGKKVNNDLTNVGVGVSQIIPIIIACLLAKEESTIIIEQPELHLHPAMQSKLTDFFVATMLCNKQLIIETHSEHIINALRHRISLIDSPYDEKISNNVQIYYVDKKDYGSSFKQITVNKYAYISDWPEGFFDEAQISNINTLRAINKKMERDPPNE